MSETTTPQTPSQSSEHISLKEIRKELYDLRKAEAQDLWKKFIFFTIVTTILALLYISLITKLITKYSDYVDNTYRIPDDAYNSSAFLTDCNGLNIGSCLIAIIALIASITWLKKAKKKPRLHLYLRAKDSPDRTGTNPRNAERLSHA